MASGPPPDPYATHRYVAEGVPLSGPSWQGELASPARFLVTRWIRGRGPRVIALRTPLSLGVGPVFSVLAGAPAFRAGEVARLFGSFDGRRVFHDNPCAFGDRRPGPRPRLRAVGGSAVRAWAGARTWRAETQRGPHGLHCVALHTVGRHTGGGKECEVGRPLLAVQHEGPRLDDVKSTAVAVGGTDVRSVRLSTPDGVLAARPRGPGHPVLVVLAGRVDAAEVRARVELGSGRVRWLQPVGYPTLVAPDPGLGRPWRAALDAGFAVGFGLGSVGPHRTCVGANQLAPRHSGQPAAAISAESACGDLRRDPYFFAVRPMAPSSSSPGDRAQPVATAVFGAARSSVVAVIVRDGSGERRLVRGRGGQFLTVYPPSVRPADLVVEVTFSDGSTVVQRGRSDANLTG